MNEKEIQELYPPVAAEEMRGRVLEAIRAKERPVRHGRLRVSAVVCAVLIAVLTAAVGAAGAAAVRKSIQVQIPETTHENPAKTRSYGMTADAGEERAVISESAIAELNRLRGYDTTCEITGYSHAETEEFLGITLSLPENCLAKGWIIRGSGSAGAEGKLSSVDLRSTMQAEVGDRQLNVSARIQIHLSGATYGVGYKSHSASSTAAYSHTMPDGSEAQLIAMRSEAQEGKMARVEIHAYYLADGALYWLKTSIPARDGIAAAEEELLAFMRTLLDSVE